MSPSPGGPGQGGSAGALPVSGPISSGLPKETLIFLARLPGAILAVAAKAPELAITKEQGAVIAEPLDGVLGKWLGMYAMQYPQEFALLVTVALVYGPGAVAYWERKSKEKAGLEGAPGEAK